MRDQYTRLIRRADPYDFNDTSENYMGYNTTQNIDMPHQDDQFQMSKKEIEVNLSDVDPMKLSKVIQGLFFDFYGTNLPNDKESEIIENLPDKVPNSLEDFEIVLLKTLKDLKVYEWVDTQIDEEITAPQELASEVDEIVDTGDTGDLDKDLVDQMLEEEQTIQEENLNPLEKAKLNKSINNQLQKAKSKIEHDEYIKHSGRDSTGSRQKRSIYEAKDLFGGIYGEEAEVEEYHNLVSEVNNEESDLAGWDVGLGGNKGAPRSTGKSRSSGGGGGDSLDGSWYRHASNSGSFNDMGLPRIDCDKNGV